MNSQGVPTCLAHKKAQLLDLKCSCGDWLDILKGKYGPYFNCMKCGNVTFRRGLEINQPIKAHYEEKSAYEKKQKQYQKKKMYHAVKETKKEITVTSDEVDFL